MKRRLLRSLATVAAVAMIAVVDAQQAAPETALRAAIEQETIKGDLKGAIAAYQKIADSPAHSRAARAEALVRMGSCYLRLGDTQARKSFERVLREFGDQAPLALRARAALRDLDASASRGTLTIRRLGILPEVANSISDSGLFAAGTDWDTGNIVVWDIATGTSRRVTDQRVARGSDYGEFGQDPIFSPDATQVAYTWCATANPATATSQTPCDGQLRISRIRESGIDAPRILYRESEWTAPVAWSRDGSTIAAFAHVNSGATSDLLLISTEDGRSTRLDRFERTDAGNRVAFSPDGKYVAASVLLPSKAQSDLFVFDVATKKRLPVAVSPADERLIGWTPDGADILFASDVRGAYNLYGVGFVHGAVTGPPTMLQADLGAADQFMVSSTGTLYYSKQSGRASTVRLAAIDFSNGMLSAVPEPSEPIYAFAPIWTRDGAALVYLSSPNVIRGSRMTLRLESNGTRREMSLQITPTDRFTSLKTTADPNVVLLEGISAKGEAGLYQIDLPTGRATLLVQGARQVEVSRDGRRLYYFRRDGAQHELIERDLSNASERTILSYQHSGDIRESAYVSPDRTHVVYRLPDVNAAPPEPQSRLIDRELASGRERELLTGRLGELRPSPDGRYLAVMQDDPSGGWNAFRLVALADSEASKELMRIERGQGLHFCAWSPDSHSLLLDKAEKGSRTSWWVPISGRAPRQLAQYIDAPSIHPDGKTIAYSVSENTPLQFEFWAVDRFLRRAQAPRPEPGTWWAISPGASVDESLRIEATADGFVMFSPAHGGIPWGPITVAADGSIEFHRAGDPQQACTLKRTQYGTYEGSCRGSVGRRLTLAKSGNPGGLEIAAGETDLKVLARARQILSGPSVWNREDRVCDHSRATQTWSLLCALNQASLDVTGTSPDLRPVMEEARAAVIEVAHRSFQGALKDFNSLESTTYGDIVKVFDVTERRLRTMKACLQGADANLSGSSPTARQKYFRPYWVETIGHTVGGQTFVLLNLLGPMDQSTDDLDDWVAASTSVKRRNLPDDPRHLVDVTGTLTNGHQWRAAGLGARS